MGKIARVDWPRQWPQLFPNLVASLVSGGPTRRRMALCGTNEVSRCMFMFTACSCRGHAFSMQGACCGWRLVVGMLMEYGILIACWLSASAKGQSRRLSRLWVHAQIRSCRYFHYQCGKSGHRARTVSPPPPNKRAC